MTGTTPMVVTVRVTCADDGDVPKVVEVLTRAASGLALEGLFVAMFAQREDEEDTPCG